MALPYVDGPSNGELMQVFRLRSWYYYARHLIYRPFVHKALHAQELMTAQDCVFAANCLQASLLWPLVMPPCTSMKRIIPGKLEWTHNCVELLLVLRMIRESDMLGSICDQYIDADELRQTTFALLSWVEDMSQVDGLAEWAVSLMAKLFPEFNLA